MKLQILDTTLRDGGFLNNFDFGEDEKYDIEYSLHKSGLDYIEIGYVNSNVESKKNKSLYKNLRDISCKFNNAVAMIDFGNVNIEDIPEVSEVSINMIRISFYKEQCYEALDFARKIEKKGYRISLQLMITSEYDEEELNDVITIINHELYNVDIVYIVDSFGELMLADIKRLYLLLNEKLNANIKIGLHLHNNRGQVYSCLQQLPYDERVVVIDSTLLGIGKGAGNVATETLIDIFGLEDKYNLDSLYDIIDKSVAKYLGDCKDMHRHKYIISAKLHCSPTYIKHYSETYNLTTTQIFELIKYMDRDRRRSFDIDYADDMYEKNKNAVMLKTIKSSWNDMAIEYDTFHPCNEDGKVVFKDIIEKHILPGGSVLDVGTGTGFLAEICYDCGYKTKGIDISNEMIDLARKKSCDADMNIDYDVFDGENYNFENNIFDGIVSSRVLWTIINPKKVLNEWHRILKKDGVMIAFTTIGKNDKNERKRCYGGKLDYSLFFFKYCGEDELIKCFKEAKFKEPKIIYLDNDEKNEQRAACIIAYK